MTTPQQSAMRKALESEGCERLRDFYNVGPAQRAALESFVAALAQQVEQQPVAPLTDEQVQRAMHAINEVSCGDIQPTFEEMRVALLAARGIKEGK